MSTHHSGGRRVNEFYLIEGDTFAIHSEFVGSGRGYKTRCYRVEGRDGELISSPPVPVFYLPYADYRVYRR
jgi:hypothetical protein